MSRDRLEMVLMLAAGWSPSTIAEHLGRHPHTTRSALKGFGGIRPRPGPGPPGDRNGQVVRTARPGADRSPVGRRSRPGHRPLLGPAEGGLPMDRPDRRGTGDSRTRCRSLLVRGSSSTSWLANRPPR
ncbi:MAG: helix-turn-helix domain-containing protein [Planctomycetes bacterium]|nr:helix-turn-helix domain-containing protein [Planctomycetota bacterium]